MASELGISSVDQQCFSGQRVKKPLEMYELQQIIENLYDSIIVTDKFGNVMWANASTERFLGVNPEELIGNNTKDLVNKGIYDWSPAMKVIETRSMVTGLLKSGRGSNIICTSTPLMDKNGEIVMVISNARDKELVNTYLEAVEKEKSKAEKFNTPVEHLNQAYLGSVIAKSQQMRQVMETVTAVAKTDSTVMLFGESGTGKEVVARYIHKNSLRSKNFFIPVNCAAIPNELLESEFFGYAPGAFTGANSRGKPGLFEIADKGTLFLDEIGELPLAMQAKLLRVLETGKVPRLGGTTLQRTDVRLIAATNRDLKAMVGQNMFRSDLYYRLNVIPVNLPPLRERPEDILPFANRFLEELNKKYDLKKTFSPQTIEALLYYNWPGNVRELRNVVERMVITSTSDNLDFKVDSFISCKARGNNTNDLSETKIVYRGPLKSTMKELEEQYIKQVLIECNGQVREAARRLGIHRSVLYRKIAEDK